MFCFAEWFDGTGAHGSDMRYYDLVKYEITPDGLIEKHLIHCRMHFLSDDDTIVDY